MTIKTSQMKPFIFSRLKYLKSLRIYLVLLIAFFNFDSVSQKVLMVKDGLTYRVPCKVNGLSLSFILDTGADNVSISLSEAIFMLKNGYLDSSDFRGVQKYQLADGDIVEGSKLIIKKLEIGELVVENIEASVIPTLNAPMLLGQSALSKLGKISIDYKNNILSVEPTTYKKTFEVAESKVIETTTVVENQEVLNEEIETDYEEPDYESIINDLTKLIEQDSANYKNYFYRGRNYSWSGQYEKGLMDLNKAKQINPSNPEIYAAIAQNLTNLGDTLGAIQIFNDAKIKYPSAEMYFESAEFNYHFIDNYKKAIEDIGKAIKLKPDCAEYYYVRYHIKSWGQSFMGVDRDIPSIISDLTLAIKYDPTNFEYYSQRASYYEDYYSETENIEDLKKGLADISMAIQYDSEMNERFYMSRARINESLGNYQSAINEYLFLLSKIPENLSKNDFVEYDTVFLYVKIAINKLDLKDTLEAMSYCNEAIKLGSTHARPYAIRAEIKYSRRDYLGAIEDWTNAIQRVFNEDKKLDYYFGRGKCYFGRRRYNEAIKDFNFVLKGNPDDYNALYNRGICYLYLKEIEKACIDWSKSGELGFLDAYDLIEDYCN